MTDNTAPEIYRQHRIAIHKIGDLSGILQAEAVAPARFFFEIIEWKLRSRIPSPSREGAVSLATKAINEVLGLGLAPKAAMTIDGIEPYGVN